MNILHISDLHFGPRHWDGDNQLLLEKLNEYAADIVINTGDSTTDGLEDEYAEAGRFLGALKCKNVISCIGNHDKRNMRSHELFRKYIYNSETICLPETAITTKKHLFLNRKITKVNENFTDVNFIRSILIKEQTILVISIDSNELYSDDGYVEREILTAVSMEIEKTKYDKMLLMTHYSILGTDECPLKNSACLIDFVQKHNIKYVFCGHTHELELMRTNDLYHGHSFYHFMCGTLSSGNHDNDDNMFLYFENFGSDNMHLYLIRMFPEPDKIHFKEEKVF
ncbi:metallophosphoesterase [uncultured Desulfuromusa sp.]|uniref:metallophosphoesterase family protein n=1 Tax=uncultured Desulfuromusa sp. TaxID=219183 RepID=UPI002AA68491|nr:metallophosphoesterase [uncultured Desulfuromusa sp.]